MSKFRINYIVLIVIIFFIIFRKKLYNLRKNNNTANKKNNNDKTITYNNIISINKSFNIFNLEEILSEDNNENLMNDKWYDMMKNKFKIQNIHIEPINNKIKENNMEECFKYYSSFDKIIYYEINKKSTDIIEQKNKNIPEFCKNIINKLYESISNNNENDFLEDEIESININFDFQDEIFGHNKDIKNILLESKNEGNKQRKKNENNSNIKNNYDDELEQYYINSRKDCIEYGLKSLNEVYLVCTKYE